jgi:uncharacterized membrane protein
MALLASLVLNGFLFGAIFGAVFYAYASANKEGNMVDVVPGGGVSQDPDETYEAGKMGFKP